MELNAHFVKRFAMDLLLIREGQTMGSEGEENASIAGKDSQLLSFLYGTEANFIIYF